MADQIDFKDYATEAIDLARVLWVTLHDINPSDPVAIAALRMIRAHLLRDYTETKRQLLESLEPCADTVVEKMHAAGMME